MGWRSPWSATWSMVERSILSQGREYYLRAILRIYNWSTSCWIIRYAFQIIDTVQRWTSLRVPGRPWYARPCRQVRVRSRDTPGQFCHARRSSSRHRCSLHDTHSRRTFRLPRGVQKSKPSYIRLYRFSSSMVCYLICRVAIRTINTYFGLKFFS